MSPLPADFAVARQHLLPLVRPTVEWSVWQLQCEVRGIPSDPELPGKQITPNIGACLAFDREESITRITAEQLRIWGVSVDEAFDIALTNLRRRSSKPLAKLSSGLCAADWADTYGSSRLLLLDLFTSLSVQGAPIVMAPSRDVLLVTGSEDEAGLRSLVLHARKVLGNPRPLSARVLQLESGVWRELVPDPSMPVHAELIELQEERTSSDYAEQKALLDEINKRSGIDVFVAAHRIREDPKSGKFAGSLTTWTDGADSLLPRAQSIALVQLEPRRVVLAPWEKVVRIAGELLEPAGYWPERFRARSFPSREQLDRIASSG